MEQILPTSLIIFGLLLLSAFFSGSETALTATSRARMRSMEDQGSSAAGAVNKLISDRERLIGAILLGNNLVNILASALATSMFISLFPDGPGEVYATIVMTVLVLVFAEVTPKTAAIARPEAIAMLVARPMRIVVTLFAPVTAVVQWIVRSSLRTFGLDVSRQADVLSVSDEIKGALDLHHEEGQIDKEARDIIRGALELDDIRVEEIMLHRKQIEMLDISLPVDEIISAMMNSNHTRIPLWKDDSDNIVGVLHAKDLLRALWSAKMDTSRIDIASLAMEPYFVPETTTLQEQLDAFKLTQQHFALIVDEYGALMGLVTLEDILEEIVGEIEDEYDEPLQGVRPQSDGSINVDGSVTIRDLNRAMDWRLPDEEAVTIAGLVIHEGQCIPDVGQIFSFHGFRFEVLKRRRNQITALKVTPLEQ
ncbi:HlyC/CorC family transporter [Aquisalinus flavus]|uniref:Membrane protein n=1 Tax=Aquisalinus flavus TaxID=1526572 RepID=A0A8J2Y637_9PROT|nr:HlyC/CorC family transporter [Aquisalinus flavus]MBD0427931.1 HlyC/CorC family transporter [Aquisalinus flavus]UNE47688.1 HlyC/CorC family transporter [Aquisalinus flavus]GGD05062.1 membrane protein [Aquisalinus flavus]